MAAPTKPDLVFRIGFAGNRKLPEDGLGALQETLAAVYEAIGTRLKEIAPGTPLEGHVAKVARFYSDKPPLLRLVTGLAEGADALAMQVLLDQPRDEHLRLEAAAVVPFDRDVYRDSRDSAFHRTFDDLASQCAYVMQLDGIYEKPTLDTPVARQRRSRGYRNQSTVLLRHCDMLVVIADTSAEGKAGGSLETMGRALAFDIPVLLIEANTAQIICFEPADDLEERLAAGQRHDVTDSVGVARLRSWITVLVADPDTEPAGLPNAAVPTPHGNTATGEALLREFFAGDSGTPAWSADGKRRSSYREICWQWFHGSFKPRDLMPAVSDTVPRPLAAYSQRASELTLHYAGLYRGTFVLNYLFVILAVTIATFSLLLMGQDHTGTVNDVANVLNTGTSSDAANAKDATSDEPGVDDSVKAVLASEPGEAHGAERPSHQTAVGGMSILLLLLAVVKLALVTAIFWNTHTANHGDWNDKAIDCRYLAERLRISNYLPLVGSFQPPAASEPQFASRVLRQSSIDWLFDAITRSVSPSDIDALAIKPLDEQTRSVRQLRVDPSAALEAIRGVWLRGQIAYHANNTRTMNRMYTVTERVGRILNVIVIVVVVFDVAILACHLFGLLPELTHRLHVYAPLLVFSSAVLPAAVAGLNGIRFQSECRRLADRSHVMQRLLQRNDRRAETLADNITAQQAAPATNLGSWTPEVLRLAETIARDMVEEVSEWSVIYAKELPEP